MSLSQKITTGIILGVAIYSPAAAETVVVTPSAVPSLVRSGNLDLAAARHAIDEAAGRMLAAGRLENPEVELGGQHNHRFQEGGVEIGLSQQFPLTDRLSREREVSAVEVEAAREELRNIERLLIADTQAVLVRLLMLRQRGSIIDEQMKVSTELADYIAKAADRGEGSVLDAGRARLEAVRYAAALRQFDAKEAAETGELKRLVGLSVKDEIRVGGSLPSPYLPGDGVDAAARPDRRAAALELEKSAVQVELERSKRIADLKVGMVAGIERVEDAPEGFFNEGIIGFRMSLPLPFWNKNEGGIAEAQARKARREGELVALDQKIHNEAATARAEMVQWLAMANSIQNELLPLAEKQAERADQAYRNGQGDLQAVLAVREQQLELAGSRLEALQEYHLARVRFETAGGE